MRNLFKKLGAIVLCASMALCGVACQVPSKKSNIKNVILIIGDGMGENHIQNTLMYFDLPTPECINDQEAVVFTYSNNSGVTDSAAAATAMSTGKKVNNGSICYSPSGEKLTSISTLAKNAGKKVGIVTTDTLDGATPAGFSAQAYSRNDSQDIARSQAKSNIDLFMGKSTENYQTRYSQFFMQSGYEVLHGAPQEASAYSGKKVTALLPETRSSYNPDIQNEYQLKDMVAFALDFLQGETGYFLMIEGAYIDKYSHNNQLIPALCETRSLLDTVEYLYQTVGTDTAILFTADHETGKLKKAPNKDLLSDILYNSGDHSATPVPLFLKNCQLDTDASSIENTEIFKICKSLLNL